MTTSEYYQALLRDLGKTCGLQDLAPDDSAYCCLLLDEKISVQMQLNPITGILTLFSPVGHVGESDPKTALLEHLLWANLFWQGTGGATLGWDRETGQVIFGRQVSLSEYDSGAFQRLVEDFANNAEAWTNHLDQMKEALSQADEPSAPNHFPLDMIRA